MTLVARGQNLVVHKEKLRYAPRNDKVYRIGHGWSRAPCGSVCRQTGSGGDAAVVDADGCGAGGEGGRETSVDWGIGDGGDGRNRGAPVRVNGDVLSGAVAEGTGRS